MNDCEMYYCVDRDLELWILGNHGDWEAAQATAIDMGLRPMAIIGEHSASQWYGVLGSLEADKRGTWA